MSGETAGHVVEIVRAAQASAREGRAVALWRRAPSLRQRALSLRVCDCLSSSRSELRLDAAPIAPRFR